MGQHKLNETAQFHAQQPTLNIDEMANLKCENCECDKFDTVFVIKKISAIASAIGREQFMPIEFFRCVDCKEITKIFKSNGRR